MTAEIPIEASTHRLISQELTRSRQFQYQSEQEREARGEPTKQLAAKIDNFINSQIEELDREGKFQQEELDKEGYIQLDFSVPVEDSDGIDDITISLARKANNGRIPSFALWFENDDFFYTIQENTGIIDSKIRENLRKQSNHFGDPFSAAYPPVRSERFTGDTVNDLTGILDVLQVSGNRFDVKHAPSLNIPQVIAE